MSHYGSGPGADSSGSGGPHGPNSGPPSDNRNYYSSRYNNSSKNPDSSSYNGRRSDQLSSRDSRDYYGGYLRPSGGYRGRGRAPGGAIYSSSASAASSATPSMSSSSSYRKRPYDKYDTYSSKYRKPKDLMYKDSGSHYLGKYDKYEPPDNDRSYDSRHSLEKPDLVFPRKERSSDSYSSSFNDDRRNNDKSDKPYDHRGYKDDKRNFVANKSYSDDRRRPKSSSIPSLDERRRTNADVDREKSLSSHSSRPSSKQPSPAPQGHRGPQVDDERAVGSNKKDSDPEGELKLGKTLRNDSFSAEPIIREASLSDSAENKAQKEGNSSAVVELKKEPQQKTSFAAYLTNRNQANKEQQESSRKAEVAIEKKGLVEKNDPVEKEENVAKEDLAGKKDSTEKKDIVERIEPLQKADSSGAKDGAQEAEPTEKSEVASRDTAQENANKFEPSQDSLPVDKGAPATEPQEKHISGVSETANANPSKEDRKGPPTTERTTAGNGPEQNTQDPASEEKTPIFAVPKAPESSSNSHNDITPLSPITGNEIADSSVLSPIGDKVSMNESFIKDLQGDKKEPGLDSILDDEKLKDEDLSEAETVILNSPPRMTQGHKLARRKDRHELKRKLKQRKVIFTSDEEEEEEEVEDQDASRRESEEEGEEADSDDDKRLSRTQSNASNSGRPKKSNAPYKVKRDSTGRTLLQRACIKGDVSEVELFLERGADANESDFGGFTCLHEAALAGHTEVVQCLLDHGADVNRQAQEAGYCETPLMDAAENKHVDTVKMLLRHGADPQIYNSDGYNALTKIYHLHGGDDGYDEIIKLLDKAIESQGGSSGRTVAPLLPDKVIEDPNEEYFTDLLKKKNITSTIYRYVAQGLKERAAEDFLAHNFTLQSKPDILILAARNGHMELVDILLGLNPGNFDMNQMNKVGTTALLAAVGRGNLDVIKFLLSKGADPSKRREADGLNSLEVAKYSAHYDPREVDTLMQAILGDLKKEKPLKSEVEKATGKKDEAIKTTEKPNKASTKSSDKEHEKSLKAEKDHDVDDKYNDSMEIDSEDDIRPPKGMKRKTSSVSIEGVPSKKKAKPRGSEFSTPEPPSDFKRMKSSEPTGSPQSAHERQKPHSPSPAPAPLTQAQIEQKQRAAEEARIWQEKVAAKKRARKESFLKNEKDKERKRKEEEIKKIEEQKQLEIMQHEEKVKAAKAVEELQKRLEEEKALLVQKLTYQSYPVGIRNARFGQKLTLSETLRYTPLYVFEVDHEEYVTDVQLALLTGVSISSLYEKLPPSKAVVLSSEDKAKMWDVFYPMLGVDKNNPSSDLREEGRKKFGNLLIKYVKKADAIQFLESGDFADAFRVVIEEKRVVKVDLLPVSEAHRRSVVYADDEVEVLVNVSAVEKASFVPPRLRWRKDAMRAIQAAKTPLW